MPAMPQLKSGKKAPPFALRDRNGDIHRLSDSKGNFTVVYFYPKDNTPGCTVEAKEFTKHLKKFERLKTRVIGISGGDEESKQAFCKAHNLKITLLSDPSLAVAKKFGSFGKKSFMGRTYQGIYRKTFILDNKQKVIKVYDKVTPQTHAEEILEFLKSFPAKSTSAKTVRSVQPKSKKSTALRAKSKR